jgi:hypothetical protein
MREGEERERQKKEERKRGVEERRKGREESKKGGKEWRERERTACPQRVLLSLSFDSRTHFLFCLW